MELEVLPRRVPTAESVRSVAHSLSRLSSVEKVEVQHANEAVKPADSEPQPSALRRHVIKARVQFSALCWCMFLAGWNDGTTGPLLPRIQEVYHVCLRYIILQTSCDSYCPANVYLKVEFAVVALIFVFACVVCRYLLSLEPC